MLGTSHSPGLFGLYVTRPEYGCPPGWPRVPGGQQAPRLPLERLYRSERPELPDHSDTVIVPTIPSSSWTRHTSWNVPA